MRHAPERSTPLDQNVAENCPPGATDESAETESSVTQEEATQHRQEKLDAIRVAIARGNYDSDELLQKSMGLLLQRLEQSRSLQD
jgi:anti-sigma28 factor (negative regulator of flagellin synthesis)